MVTICAYENPVVSDRRQRSTERSGRRVGNGKGFQQRAVDTVQISSLLSTLGSDQHARSVPIRLPPERAEDIRGHRGWIVDCAQ